MLESGSFGQQNRSASISPGWNDPPPITTTATPMGINNNNGAEAGSGGDGGVVIGRLHLQRQRRPVDPSIQSVDNFVQLHGNNNNNINNNASSAAATSLQPTSQQQQHFHQSHSFPQLAAAAAAVVTTTAVRGSPLSNASGAPPLPLSSSHHGGGAAFGGGVHPASAFTPIGTKSATAPIITTTAAAPPPPPPTIAHSHSFTLLSSQSAMPSPLLSAASGGGANGPQMMLVDPNHCQYAPPPPPLVPPTLLAITTNNNATNLPHPSQPPLLPSSNPDVSTVPPPLPPSQQLPTAQVQSVELNSSPSNQQQFPPPLPSSHLNWTTQPVAEMAAHQKLSSSALSIAANNGGPLASSPMLFAPPNIVPIATDHPHFSPHYQQQQFHSSMLTDSHCAAAGGGGGAIVGMVDNYKVPVKAAGDVSLNGLQLAAFLTKATLLLQPGPTREGIQLRFNQFGEHVQAGQISEACLKKLNFVVDAIDRHVYDEAWQFFEQMIANFQTDCAIGGWAHGVRLLLQELLRKQQSLASHATTTPARSHSAGTRLTH